MNKIRPQCGLILENEKGEILLQLRDNKMEIPYPNCWGTFGGQVEEGESPEEAIIREIKEEIGYSLEQPEYFGNFPYQGYDIYMFKKVDSDIQIEKLKVQEGQAARFFSEEKLKELEFAFNCRYIVKYYFDNF
ncbi:MAG: hypothetical protein APR63_14595 [Desulfuromonas sp. SDB]|nr:MAG: hypothetical protein APR63_14595 [Desulfuromonas sp. SDB]